MANRNTKAYRKNNRASGNYTKGRAVNSSEERKASGRQPYDAPTMKEHPISKEKPKPRIF